MKELAELIGLTSTEYDHMMPELRDGRLPTSSADAAQRLHLVCTWAIEQGVVDYQELSRRLRRQGKKRSCPDVEAAAVTVVSQAEVPPLMAAVASPPIGCHVVVGKPGPFVDQVAVVQAKHHGYIKVRIRCT